jgi:hypothetical protein
MANESTTEEKSNVEKPYLVVFTLPILRVLALVSLGVAVLLFGVALLAPRYFELDFARLILCLAVATTLSIFFFVFYPQTLEANLPSILGVTLRVVGPVALWFGVLAFSWHLMPRVPLPPAEAAGYVFKPYRNGKPGGVMYDPETKIWVQEGAEMEYRLIPNRDDRGLYGIYVKFPPNVLTYKATLEHKPYEPIDVEFARNGPYTFDVSRFKRGASK